MMSKAPHCIPSGQRSSFPACCITVSALALAGCTVPAFEPREDSAVLDSWTAELAGDRGYAHAATLYFTLSTWMPYQVILASMTVHLP